MTTLDSHPHPHDAVFGARLDRTSSARHVLVGAALALVSALPAGAADDPPLLRFSGTCPGDATVAVSGLTPSASASFFRATSRGDGTVPAGPCAGTPLGLSDPTRVTVRTSDANGAITVSPTLSETVCNQYLRVVDVSTCTVSNLTQVTERQVLAVTGDLVDVGTAPLTITSIDSIVINGSAEWLLEVDTDAADLDTSEFILETGFPLHREGDVLSDPTPPPGFSDAIDRFDSLQLNEEGRAAFTFCFDGGDGVPDDSCVGTFELDSAVFLDDQLAAAEGQTSGPFVYASILETKLNKNEHLLVAAALDPPSPERALVLIDEIDGPADQEIVRVGDLLLGAPVEDLRVGAHGYAFNDLDQSLFVADLAGPTETDSVIFLEPDDIVVAREGITTAPPPNSKLYGDLSGTNGARVALNALGSVAFRAETVGDCCEDSFVAPLALALGCTPEPADAVLVLDPDPDIDDDEILIAEIGDEFPAGSGNTVCGFGAPVELDDSNRVIYTVKWNDPDDCPAGLVRYANGESAVVLEAGDTVFIDGGEFEIESFCGPTVADEARCYDVSPSGDFVGVRANLTDGREVALLIAL